MKVAVSGASGLIGSALVPVLRGAGHDVVRLVRKPPQSTDEVEWDPAHGIIRSPGLAGVNAAVNLSGAGIAEKRWTPERKRVLLESRLGATRLLAETVATLSPQPEAFLSGSAIGWYGDTGSIAKTEEDPAGAGFAADLVRQWEEAAEPAAAAGVRTVLLRSGIVLSTEGGALAKQLPLFKLGAGGRLGTGEQYLSWISIDDEVGAILHALTHDDLTGPVNLVAPAPVTNAEFTVELGRALHRPTVLPVPLIGPRALFGRELVEELFLRGQRVMPARLEASGYQFRAPDLPTALRRILGD